MQNSGLYLLDSTSTVQSRFYTFIRANKFSFLFYNLFSYHMQYTENWLFSLIDGTLDDLRKEAWLNSNILNLWIQ